MHIVAVLFCFPLFDRGLVMVTHMHAKIIEIVPAPGDMFNKENNVISVKERALKI